MLVLAATNRPQDLDEAALRRLTRRIFMPLPDVPARQALIDHKLKDANKDISEDDAKEIHVLTEGFSCADLDSLIKEAAMLPVRELTSEQLTELKDKNDLRPLSLIDF